MNREDINGLPSTDCRYKTEKRVKTRRDLKLGWWSECHTPGSFSVPWFQRGTGKGSCWPFDLPYTRFLQGTIHLLEMKKKTVKICLSLIETVDAIILTTELPTNHENPKTTRISTQSFVIASDLISNNTQVSRTKLNLTIAPSMCCIIKNNVHFIGSSLCCIIKNNVTFYYRFLNVLY